MRAQDYIAAARVPASLQPQTFGLWTIDRIACRNVAELLQVGFEDYTVLHHVTEATLHLPVGDIVMEDSRRELSKHLPIWMSARGRILVTGLGLGCVVRGLLANHAVEHIDVVEIDAGILRVVGPEFAAEPRVALHHADALAFDPAGRRWDFAWHDIWTDGERHLQRLHADLMMRFWDHCGQQGAWAWPREIGRRMPIRLLGAPRPRKALVRSLHSESRAS